MELIQFTTADGTRCVGSVAGDRVTPINDVASVHELALAAIRAGHGLEQSAGHFGAGDDIHSLSELLTTGRVLAPLDHADPKHCLVTGTGLTHTGSADTRDSMHTDSADTADSDTDLTDSMKMFRWGLAGGQPERGEAGVQPEWFYKGDGNIVVSPEGDLPSPVFGLDLGEEPEIAGLYVVGDDGTPYRLGYALANEASDHVTERQNYLYLAHSKLRPCAFGPVMTTGALPDAVEGVSRIWRGGETLWEKPFQSGEAHMSHSLENLEYHHFKYDQFRQPGDVHIHLFGTATLSVADGVETRTGDVFEINAPAFGPSLRNRVVSADSNFAPGQVAIL